MNAVQSTEKMELAQARRKDTSNTWFGCGACDLRDLCDVTENRAGPTHPHGP
jgi:hypothetical protein